MCHLINNGTCVCFYSQHLFTKRRNARIFVFESRTLIWLILVSYRPPCFCLKYPLSLVTSLAGGNWAIMGVFCYVLFYSKAYGFADLRHLFTFPPSYIWIEHFLLALPLSYWKFGGKVTAQSSSVIGWTRKVKDTRKPVWNNSILAVILWNNN